MNNFRGVVVITRVEYKCLHRGKTTVLVSLIFGDMHDPIEFAWNKECGQYHLLLFLFLSLVTEPLVKNIQDDVRQLITCLSSLFSFSFLYNSAAKARREPKKVEETVTANKAMFYL